MMPCSSVRMRRIAFGALAALVMTGPAVAIAAESATQTTAPANTPAIAYGPNGADLTTAIPTWSYTRNSVIQANATTKTAGNNAQGSLVAGWPVDIFNRAGVVRETLDWTEGVIATPSTAYLFPSMGVALTSVTQAGGTVTATGAWQGGPVSAVTSYTALGEAPVVKVDVQLTNKGAAAIDSSFGYIMDPDDTGAQTSILQGVGNNPGLVSSGWTSNFTYQGPPSNATASPGHAIAWAADNPAAISAGSAYTSVWFPVSLAPGATDTITLYHIVDLPAAGTDPTANARNWASQLLTLDPTAAAEVSQVAGRVSGAGGADLGGVTVKARRIDSTLAATATSLADGTYSMLLQPGTYTLTASRLGYTSDSRSVEVVSAGGPYQLDFEVDPVAASADTEREIPGALGEGGPDDIVLENQQLAMAVADAFSDPQLAPATKGKPIDLAAAGFNDGIDWLNLPYLHPSRPVGGDAWQVTSLIGDTVEIVDPGPVHAVVRTTGHWTVDPNVSVETVYSLEPGQPYVTAETIFSNSGPSPVTAFTGDAIDVDDGATVSHVPGAGEITLPYESPGTFVPTDPWIAAYGAQAQTFGLVYTDDFAFEALANTNWIMSIGEITIPAGGETSFTRRIVAAPSTNAGDRAAPVREVWERIVLERTGLTASMSVDDDHVAAGDIVTASVVVENVGSDPVAGASVSFNPGIFTSLDPLTKPVGELPPGEQQTITFRARAQQGGSTTISTTLLLGSEAVSTKSAKIVVDGPGWYLGDNHTHSTFSDGSGTIAQNMASARSKGLSWLVATDHNTVDQRTQLAPEVRDDFVPMYGEEVTAGYGHSLAYNINSLIAAVSPPQTMLNNVNANNGGKAFLYIAHPYYPGLEWDDWNAIDGLRGIEVWNGFYPPKHVVNTSAFAKWDELNRAGRHLLGLANSDAHNPGKIGSPSIRAYLDELSETEVVQALATGGFYGTDGVDVRFTVNGVRMGGDVQVPPSGGPVSVDLSASHAPGIDAVRLYVDGSVVQTWTPASAAFDEVLTLQLMPGQFVRVEADGAGGRFAFSNPIWITAGDATIDAPVLARIVGATTEDVSLDWTGVAAATAYEIDEAPVPTDVVGSPTTNIDWSADVAGFSTDPAASTTSTLVFNTTGATVLAFDEVLDTEPAIDFATVTAISGDGTRSTLRRESGASGGTRAVALALPDGTVAVEFALPVDANEGGRDYSGWALTDLRIGSPTFIMVGSATETTNSLVGRSPGEYVYRVRALLIGGAEATSNLQPVVVAAPPPGPVVPEAPIVALLGLCAIGIFLLARRQLLARA